MLSNGMKRTVHDVVSCLVRRAEVNVTSPFDLSYNTFPSYFVFLV